MDETLETLGEYDPTMELESEPTTSSLEAEDVSQTESLNEESNETSSVPEHTDINDIIITDVIPAPKTRAAGYVELNSNYRIYELTISGNNYRVAFPKDANLSEASDMLINTGSSSVTGIILENNDSVPITSYIHQTYTLLPALTAGSNNNRYQYGALGYITTYSPGSYNLQSTQAYANNNIVSTPGFGSAFSVDALLISGLLLMLVIIQIIGGVIRK